MRCLKLAYVIVFCCIMVACVRAARSDAGRFLHHHSHMTVAQKVRYFERSVAADRRAIRWLRSRYAPRTLQRVDEISWSRHALKWHLALLRQYRAKLPPPWPPHHRLWLCIHGGEGAWADRDSGGNGHYGGLQMHPGWGYGTSWYASDDSQLEQEWAAERAYRASRFSSGWLWQQWAADARCFA